MAFYIGSFAGGLFNGASSALSIATAYQKYQEQSAIWDAAKQNADTQQRINDLNTVNANVPGWNQDTQRPDPQTIQPGDSNAAPPATTAPTQASPTGGPSTGNDQRLSGQGAQPSTGQGNDQRFSGQGAQPSTKPPTGGGESAIPASWLKTDLGIRMAQAAIDAASKATGSTSALATQPVTPPAPTTPVLPGGGAGGNAPPPADFSNQTGLPIPQGGGPAAPALPPSRPQPVLNAAPFSAAGAPGAPGSPSGPPAYRPDVNPVSRAVTGIGDLLHGASGGFTQPAPPGYQPPAPSVTEPAGGYFGRTIGPQTPPIPTGRPGGPIIPPQQTPASPPPPAAQPAQTVPQAANVPPPAPSGGVGSTILGALKSVGQSILPSAEAAEANTPAQAQQIALAQAKDSGTPVKIAGTDQVANPDGSVTGGGQGAAATDTGVSQATAIPTRYPEPSKPQAPSATTPAQPQTDQPVATSAKVVPGQQGPTTQSEVAPPKLPKLNMDAWNRLSPADQSMLDRAARDPRFGNDKVTGPELAAVWQNEGGLQHSGVPDNPAGSHDPNDRPHGPFQIKPSTQRSVDLNGIDTSTAEGGAQVAARLFAKYNHDDGFAPGSMMIHLAYMAGETGAQEIQRGTRPLLNEQRVALSKRFPDANIDSEITNGGSGRRYPDSAVANAVLQGSQKGPDGVLHAIVETGPTGIGMSQLWRTAQSAAERYAILSGHPEALPGISEFYAMQSHQGALSHMAAAYNAMLDHNPELAAQHLAKSHAFFPDGSYANFGVDGSGNLWATQHGETTNAQISQFQITPDALARQMIQLQSGPKFLQTLQEYRAKNADIELKQQHAEYYREMPEERAREADLRAQAAADRQAAADQRHQDQLQHQQELGEAKVASSDATDERNVRAAINKDYGSDYAKQYPGEGDTPNPKQAEVDTVLRRSAAHGGGGMSAPMARSTAAEYLKPGSSLRLAGAKDDKGTPGYVLVDKDGNPRSGYLSSDMGSRILGIAGTQKVSPPAGGPGGGRVVTGAIGAGSGSPMVAMQGLNQNMAGVQSAAIPTSQPQQTMAA